MIPLTPVVTSDNRQPLDSERGEHRTHGVIPFDTFVVKVVSRCNLNCAYCYMYNLQDGTYRNQPTMMLEEVTAAL